MPERVEGPDTHPVIDTSGPLVSTPAPTPLRNIHWALIIGAAAVVVCAVVAYWQIRIIRALFNGLLPYALFIFPSLLALGTLRFKDWKNYKPHWIRWVLISFVIGAGVVGVAYQHSQREEKAETARKSQQNIDDLKGQATAAQQAQADNTQHFLEQLQQLSNKISELQTKAATEELKSQLATVKGELEKTQKALAPAPKATLLLTFPGYIPPTETTPSFVLRTEMTIPATADGNVTVPFTVVNSTDADAVDGELTVLVCDACKYVKDPEGFRHLPSAPEAQRYMAFGRILASTVVWEQQMELIIPRRVQNFDIGMRYRCRTCILHKTTQMITVHVKWPG